MHYFEVTADDSMLVRRANLTSKRAWTLKKTEQNALETKMNNLEKNNKMSRMSAEKRDFYERI